MKIKDFANFLKTRNDDIAYKYLQNEILTEKSYFELGSNINSVKDFLLSNHEQRQKIAIISQSSYHWITLCLGIYSSNNVLVSIDYNLTSEEISNMLDFSEVNIVFISKAIQNKLALNLTNKTIYVIDDVIEEIYKCNLNLECDINSDELAHILFTSGTTNAKKGVMLSYSNIEHEIFTDGFVFDTTLVFSLLPMYHCFELFVTNLFRIYCGGTVFVNDDIANLMANMQKYRPTLIAIVPELTIKFNNIIEKMGLDTFNKLTGGRLKTISIGGAPIETEVLINLQKHGIEVYNGYGLTETTSCCTATRPEDNKLGTLGKAMNEFIKIKVDENGEILVSGKTIMMGYYKNEEATKEAIKDGWLYTGDLGELDENNNLIILGRKANKIVLSNGKKIYPEELEEKLNYLDIVLNSLIYEKNNKLNALIQIAERNTDIEKQIVDFVDKLNNENVNYKKIYKVDFTTKDFPKTTTKKMKRKDLLSSLDEYIEQTFTRDFLYKNIQNILNSKDNFLFDDNIYDLGFDSLSTVELSCLLNCNPQDIYENPTVNKLYELLNNTSEEIYNETNINKYININKNLTKPFNEKNVLITGATGYLGSHILNKFEDYDEQIYCLVRNPEKLKDVYKYYFNKELPGNIEVIKGDIEKPLLGLDEEKYIKLIRKVNCVIHCAANVNHIAKYEDMHRTNVVGTENIIKFSKQSNSILHYMSTYSVSGLGLCNQSQKTIFDENVLDVGQKYQENVYVRTKYEAEEKILKARFEEGLLVNIYRIGSLTWTNSGKFQPNANSNGIVKKMHGIQKSNIVTKEILEALSDFTNVDECVEAFFRLLNDKKVNNIYHLYNPNFVKTNNLLDKEELQIITKQEMKEKIINELDQDIKFYYYTSTLLDGNDLIIKSEETIKKLKHLGFVWSTPTKEYLLMIKNF